MRENRKHGSARRALGDGCPYRNLPMKAKDKATNCAICNREASLTREHVPPKGVFAKPRPEPIIVFTCAECNHGSSDLDEELKVIMGLGANLSSPEGEDLKPSVFRSLDRNAKLKRRIAENAEPRSLTTESGVFIQVLGVSQGISIFEVVR